MAKVKMIRTMKVAVNGFDIETWAKDEVHEASDSLAFDLEEGLAAVPVTGDAKADAKAAEAAAADLAKAQAAEAEAIKAIAAGPK